ncbi:MAG TPA: hypothetical protein VF011_13905 [Terriglobales bacterium]
MKAPLPVFLVVIAALISSSPVFSQQSSDLATGPQGAPASGSTVNIPGPLRSFMRMAAISQKASPDEVLPLLARNVFIEGYEGYQSGRRPTEFLVLLRRYVQQGRELSSLTDRHGILRVTDCQQAKPLLKVLGYRIKPDCGKDSTYLETSEPERAFLTTDSGFPLPDLEEALRGKKSFEYDYTGAQVPIFFTEKEWLSANTADKSNTRDVLDVILSDPDVARLYWALSRLDPEATAVLRKSVGARKLAPLAASLDFYGTQFRVVSGRVVVPGGAGAEPAWKSLVGASPSDPADFLQRLLTRDKGWMAAYFDAVCRINESQQAHIVEPQRLRHLYEAFRGPDASSDAARAVFRPAPGLLLLLTRLQWDENDQPLIPGSLATWKDIFRQPSDSKVVRDWGKRASHWNNSEQLLEGLFALARIDARDTPLETYLLLSELDSGRPADRRLSPETVRLLARRMARFSDQYLIFCEFPELNDSSITQFLNSAEALDRISDHVLRGNAMGMFQAEVGIWQILARQGQIPLSEQNPSWQHITRAFTGIATPSQLFDAGQNSFHQALRAATGKPALSQDEIIDLLAGPRQDDADAERIRQELADRMRAVLDGQRLVSLDTVFALGDGLQEMALGKMNGDSLISAAGELREFEMPRPIFTPGERTEWSGATYNNNHTEIQMRTDLTKIIKSPRSKAQLEAARGQLVPFLRDTLVGLNYAYYEPPGSQALHSNPLLVRSHDFAGDTLAGVEKRVWMSPDLIGEGSPAGGGAHFVGSLAELPYVLAEMEQDFISPESVQALIWRELVPQFLVSATVPRWWNVSRSELHAVALHQKAGEELLMAAQDDPELRARVLPILSERMVPQAFERLQQNLTAKKAQEIVPRVTPADTFYLSAEYRRKYHEAIASVGPAGRELDNLYNQHRDELTWERLSRDFGVPHPILAQSYRRELLNIKPFPAFQGYSSRLLAESWDSSNLYWARLADETGYSPAALNRLVPELTRRMVEKIFATEFEDWPAILRALHETGNEFRQGKITSIQTAQSTTQHQ